MARERNEKLIDVVNWPEWDRLLDIWDNLPFTLVKNRNDLLGDINWNPDPALGPREDRLMLALRRGNVDTGTPIPMPSGMADGAVEYEDAMAAQTLMDGL